MEQTTGKKSKKTIILIAIIVVLVMVCGGLVYAGYHYIKDNQNKSDKEPSGQVSGSAIIVTDDNKNVVQDIKDKVERGRIEVKMTGNWVFTEGGKKSNAYLANSDRNSYALRFSITLQDTGEEIMLSPDVPVGSCIENFPLSKELEPGTYNVVIAHQQVENGEIFNTVRTSATITVQ